MRKIVQIIPSKEQDLIALCDDGSVWMMFYNGQYMWWQYPDIPQEEGAV